MQSAASMAAVTISGTAVAIKIDPSLNFQTPCNPSIRALQSIQTSKGAAFGHFRAISSPSSNVAAFRSIGASKSSSLASPEVLPIAPLPKTHEGATLGSVEALSSHNSLKGAAFGITGSLSLRKRRNGAAFRSLRALTSPPLASTFASEVAAPSHKSLKARLAAGETLYGLFLLSSSPTFAEIAGLAGYDYVVIDMEHGPGGISDALPCLRALAAASTAAVLRLPEPSAAWAKKALDLGPDGIMFPMVDSPAAAANAVSYCRFPPRGVRGSAHTAVRASAYGLDDGYLARCEDELLVMCQVESAAGIAEIEAIAAVDGVDVVQMGPLDLSASMGYLWDPGNRKVKAVMSEAERKVLGVRSRRNAAAKGGGRALGGPYLGGFAIPHDPSEELKVRGYHMVAGAVDVGLFRRAAVEDVKRFRSTEVDIGEEDEDGKPSEESYYSE